MKYHVYDPNSFGNCVEASTDTLDEALILAREILNIARKYARENGEWDESTEEIAIYYGEYPIPADQDVKEYQSITSAKMCNVINRPDDLDEDNYSESLGLSFGTADFFCDYHIPDPREANASD